MNYLIDTHVLIWVITDISKLPKNVIAKLEDNNNSVIVSSISFWEISMKHSFGKLKLNGVLPQQLPDLVKEMGFLTVSLDAEVAASYNNLIPGYHKDPFDRMLIWQAIINNYTFISNDAIIKQYTSAGLKVLW
ncbi:PIN domain nuclease of toxin-antitoxin system [Mucilaginibacter gracilis]|uniref:PIN domain nuclease of toxin-antitoxin system n=1 Tax=Mucilaginibacter gracilis TaxID=423350 RepID=A0A495IWX5_9SPHI|nr:type II toxin-antitoxin system VapC family toxin [Mucilaginibacter gracilis]RKR81185.1 PIN domain nuclease of toxin-antitoxin system [Mucilaginibacter gracilis]